MNEFYFISIENMGSVYDISDISDFSDFTYVLYQFFYKNENEVAYFVKDGCMYGVISIGDLYRCYRKYADELIINKEFTYLNTIDYKKAADFFSRVKTVCEIPVVSENNVLLGVICREKDKDVRKQQKESLRNSRVSYYKRQWHRKELARFVNNTKAKVFLYYHDFEASINVLGQDEKAVIERRSAESDEQNWKGLSDKEWRKFWGEEYEDEIVDQLRTDMGRCIPVFNKGIPVFKDMESKFFSCKNGFRITTGNPPVMERKIVLYGSCLVAGGYCKDNTTIASYLQKYLNDNGYQSWTVLNKGLCGPGYFCSRMFTDDLSEDDIVIICSPAEWVVVEDIKKSVFIGEIIEVFLNFPSLIDNVLDCCEHCNYKVNKNIAERLYEDMCQAGDLDSDSQLKTAQRQQDYYIDWYIYEYFMDYFSRYDLKREAKGVKTGAFVMFCDPFTQKSRYLIEEALKSVDTLYLFIVEDAKLQFSIDDRLCMAREGVRDLLSRITVIPAGKYIYPNKLSRSIRQGKIDKDLTEWDCEIWGEVVSEQLGIQYRFITKETDNPEMEEYNATIQRILPRFGVEVIEVTV